MKLRADDQGRIGSKKLFPPRKTFAATRLPDGSVRVVQLNDVPTPKARVVVRNGRKYLTSNRPVTLQDTRAALAEWP